MTYSECKTKIARQYGYFNISGFKESYPFLKMLHDDGFYEEVARLYAQQVAEDVRQKCADNAESFIPWDGDNKDVWLSSILNTEIILP